MLKFLDCKINAGRQRRQRINGRLTITHLLRTATPQRQRLAPPQRRYKGKSSSEKGSHYYHKPVSRLWIALSPGLHKPKRPHCAAHRSRRHTLSRKLLPQRHLLYSSDIYTPLRATNLTYNADLSHRMKIRCRLHPSLSPHSCMSKCHSILAKMDRISAYARFRPMQFRGPSENGWRASRSSPA